MTKEKKNSKYLWNQELLQEKLDNFQISYPKCRQVPPVTQMSEALFPALLGNHEMNPENNLDASGSLAPQQ